jgi:hypothetical protein
MDSAVGGVADVWAYWRMGVSALGQFCLSKLATKDNGRGRPFYMRPIGVHTLATDH